MVSRDKLGDIREKGDQQIHVLCSLIIKKVCFVKGVLIMGKSAYFGKLIISHLRYTV